MAIQKKSVKIGKRGIGKGYPVFVIAEIGTSHYGKFDLAVKLIEGAADCGADAVKLQTVNVDESYLKGEESYEVFKELWLEENELRKLIKIAKKNGIILFSTPGDFYSLEYLVKLNMPMIKVSSGLLTNHPLIKRIAISQTPMVISTGMSYMDEVALSVRIAEENGLQDIMIMHCTSLYPSLPETLNLNTIKSLDQVFPYPIGYSDHFPGYTSAIVAVALGASLIEKHLVLDKSVEGPDNEIACDLNEMKSLVQEIRNTEKMLGSYKKTPTEDEKVRRGQYRRCLMTRKGIKAGQVLTDELIVIKRPKSGQFGLPPAFFEYINGLRICRDIGGNEIITMDLFSPMKEG
jgi:sialic acid synthase SpsE